MPITENEDFTQLLARPPAAFRSRLTGSGENYFRNGIREAGHEVTEVPGVDWAEGITLLTDEERARWKSATWSRTLAFLASEKRAGRPVELFLSYLYPAQVESMAVAEIRRSGVPCVNFFCDNVREFTRVPVEYRPFDLHWVPEFEALPMYREAGMKHVHAPMPAWIAPEDRTIASEESGEVVFIGSEDFLRRELLGEVIRRGIPIRVGGSGWAGRHSQSRPSQTSPRSWRNTLHNQASFIQRRGWIEWGRKIARSIHPPRSIPIPRGSVLPTISNQEYSRLTKESCVVLGINRVPSFRRSLQNPLKYSRLRDIEAPMMGACYLTEWTEGLGQLYELGSEIETYRTAAELVVKIEELQNDPQKRAGLRRRGQQRALSDLTVAKSIEKICSALLIS